MTFFIIIIIFIIIISLFCYCHLIVLLRDICALVSEIIILLLQKTANNITYIFFLFVQHLDKRKRKKKLSLYGHSQIHVLHSSVYNIIQERKLQYDNFVQNSWNPLSLHV